MSVCPYGGWSRLGKVFRGKFTLIWDRLPRFLLRNSIALYCLSLCSTVFQVCLVVYFHFGHRSPVTSGFTLFYIGLFNSFFICSSQSSGGPRAVKVAMVTRFPFLHTGHLRCNKGVVSGSSGLPSSSCNSGIIVRL